MKVGFALEENEGKPEEFVVVALLALPEAEFVEMGTNEDGT